MTDAALEILRAVMDMVEEARLQYRVGENVQRNGGKLDALTDVQAVVQSICKGELIMYGSGGQTAKCPICGKPYKVYMHYAGDQSACPPCRREAEQNR